MTISKDGWLSGCIRVPGPLNKMYPQPNAGEGICVHSVEGTYAGALGELMKPERQASWMFTNCLDGRFIQHYPITASTWSSGNVAANTRLWAVESEGFAGTPLNASQVANMLYLASEWEQHSGLDLVRKKTLHEHGEVYNWSVPNAGPTACPSNRYLPFYEALANREEDMADPRLDALAQGIFGKNWAKRLAELAENSPLETRVKNLETNGDSVARADIAVLQASGTTVAGSSSSGTVTVIRVTGAKVEVVPG